MCAEIVISAAVALFSLEHTHAVNYAPQTDGFFWPNSDFALSIIRKKWLRKRPNESGRVTASYSRGLFYQYVHMQEHFGIM